MRGPVSFEETQEGEQRRGNVWEVRAPDGELLLALIAQHFESGEAGPFQFVRVIPLSDFVNLTDSSDAIITMDPSGSVLAAHCWLEGPVHPDHLIRQVGTVSPTNMKAIEIACTIRTSATEESAVDLFRKSLYEQFDPLFADCWNRLYKEIGIAGGGHPVSLPQLTEIPPVDPQAVFQMVGVRYSSLADAPMMMAKASLLPRPARKWEPVNFPPGKVRIHVKDLFMFTTGGLLISKSLIVADDYAKTNDWDVTLQKHDLLQTRATSIETSKIHLREIVSRLRLLTTEQLGMLQSGSQSDLQPYGYSDDEPPELLTLQLLLLAICKKYKVLYEFASEVVRHKSLHPDSRVSVTDFEDFLEEKSIRHITEKTRMKLCQRAIQMLCEAAIVSKSKVIQPTILSDEIVGAILSDLPAYLKIFPVSKSDSGTDIPLEGDWPNANTPVATIDVIEWYDAGYLLVETRRLLRRGKGNWLQVRWFNSKGDLRAEAITKQEKRDSIPLKLEPDDGAGPQPDDQLDVQYVWLPQNGRGCEVSTRVQFGRQIDRTADEINANH
jgi:hypothetical protein